MTAPGARQQRGRMDQKISHIFSRFFRDSAMGYPTVLAVFVLVTRILCRGPLYFADGPSMVESIRDKSYIIQPPGYWLFDRLAGMFPDPVLAISAMNILFSAAGAVAFYFAARFFTSKGNAFLAGLAYSTVFYLWFSGEIHSTYATQMFFPVVTYYLLLRYERAGVRWVLVAAAFTFAVGAGMRPTDGVFLIPLVLYYAWWRLPRREGVVFLFLIALFCMGWLIPTLAAFHRSEGGLRDFGDYVSRITTIQSVFTGVRLSTLANFARYFLPLVVGFWPILGIAIRNAVRDRSDWRVLALIIWIVPGSLFFLFSIIDDPEYMNYFTAALLLLAVSSRSKFPRLLTLTAVWNAVVFLVLSPVPSNNLAVNIVNSFVLRTTHGAIEQRDNRKLSDLEHFDSTD